MKTCSRCKVEKPLEAFPTNKRYKDGRHSWCSECSAAHARGEYAANTERERERCATYDRTKRKTAVRGLTQDELDQLLSTNRCAICGDTVPGGRGWNIDHDHSCCERRGCKRCIRGILCLNCNVGLGNFKDSPERLNAAVAYLASKRPFGCRKPRCTRRWE